MSGDREQYLAAGMNDYVAKPVNPAELRGALARAPMARIVSAEDEAAPVEAAAPPSGDLIPLIDGDSMDGLRDALGEEDLQALLESVPDETGRLLAEIQDALNGDDLAAARKAAHSLKGLASNFCALRIAAHARDIELEARSIDDARGMVGVLSGAIEDTRVFLEKTG